MSDIKPTPVSTDTQPMDVTMDRISNTAPPARAWVRLLRPRQWLKNALVFAAPGAAGVLTNITPLIDAFIAFVAFSLTSSAMYVFNDLADAERDRLHPTKRHRPIAAGAIATGPATALGLVLLAGATALLIVLGSFSTAMVIAIYVVSTVSYSFGLKHVPIVDILIVASGFVLRAIAGATATSVPISSWFLIVTSAGALFVVTGKRLAELQDANTSNAVRPSLDGYTVEFVRYVLALSSGVAVVAYCLWAFETPTETTQHLMMSLSAVPFVASLLRYSMIVFSGRGGEPEEIFLSDRTIQVFAAIWLGLFLAGLSVS